MSNFPENFPVPSVLTATESSNSPPGATAVDYTTKEGFLSLFDELVGILENDLNDADSAYHLPPAAVKHVTHMLRYNVPLGKLNRGLTVVQTFKLASEAANGGAAVPQEELKKAAVLGWCIEWIQASFLVSDDIMDASITRRGQPCWYKKEEIGVIAINDALILLTQFEILLHKFFNNSPVFAALHAVLIETVYQTEMGQNLDLSTQPPNKDLVNLEVYTEERHALIVKYKTAFYSFYAPIALGFMAAGILSKEQLAVTKSICLKMGRYFQIQDDYLDVYGDPEVIGKVGTDIQDAKCSWLVVQALKHATSEQRDRIKTNYGKDDTGCIEKVKQVFNELDLTARFKAFEEESYKLLSAEIEQTTVVPKEAFTGLLAKIYKRKK